MPTATLTETFEPVIYMNRAAYDRIPAWHPPVGVTQPDAPVMLVTYYATGRETLQLLQPRFQLTSEYLHSRLS